MKHEHPGIEPTPDREVFSAECGISSSQKFAFLFFFFLLLIAFFSASSLVTGLLVRPIRNLARFPNPR